MPFPPLRVPSHGPELSWPRVPPSLRSLQWIAPLRRASAPPAFLLSKLYQPVPSVQAYLRNGFLQLLRLGFPVLDFLLKTDVFPFLFGQVFDSLRHHCLELFVRLFTLLVICLQRVVVREIPCIFLLKVIEVFGCPVLCPK